MELGQRLKQARQAAGLSQRQLCGDRLTRNMLSQIENGSARPSMDTLQYFARQLGKPVSFFLEEQPAIPVRQQRLQQLYQADPDRVLALLEETPPEEDYANEAYLLEALACMTLAQAAIDQRRLPYAARLLERAKQAGDKTPCYTPDTERRRLLLLARVDAPSVQQLPSIDPELLLLARAALESGDLTRGTALLQAVQQRDTYWNFLMGKTLLQQQKFTEAAHCLREAQTYDPKQVCSLLEQCYNGLEDYKMAYFYACQLRRLEKGLPEDTL